MLFSVGTLLVFSLCLNVVLGQLISDIRLSAYNEYTRLPLMTSGMLEVQSATDSYWYSVCFDGWSDANSFVACGELGFPSVNSHYSVPGFTAVVITCHGSESSLDGCTHVVTSSCQSGRVALSCSLRGIEVTRQIRLRAGAHTGDGRVQVALDSEWGSICAGNTWDLRGANVACRQLGYGTARHYFSGEQFGQGHGTIWLTNVECYGNETHIGQCGFERISRVHDYSNYSTDGCSQRQLAALSCNTPDFGYQNIISLLDGPVSDTSTGRIVVQAGGVWGSICSDHWTIREASVACRQLGLGYASDSLKDVWQMTSSGQALQIVATNVRCRGDESSLSECEHELNFSPFGANCGSGWKSRISYVGVACTHVLPDLQLDLTQMRASIWVDVLHMDYLRCAAEERCLSESAYLPANSNTTRKLLRLTTSVWNRGTVDFRPWQTSDRWEWHQCHSHYHSMAEFAHFDILTNDTFERAAQGHKASFCLEDSACQESVTKTYRCTTEPSRSSPQGISRGCADTYYLKSATDVQMCQFVTGMTQFKPNIIIPSAQYDCQWIDVTDVRPGAYFLRVSLNPLDRIAELDLHNNHGVCHITLEERNAVVHGCFIPDDQFSP